MANLSWIDDVRQQLARHALPPAYIRRFMEELSDHLEDLKEENMSTKADMLSRLGEPNQVADAAVTAYRRRSFLGRHPTAAFLVFAVSPVVSIFALFAAIVFGLFVACDAVDSMVIDGLLRRAGTSLPSIMSALTVILPSMLVSILYCRLANRLCISKKWVFVSCAVIAAMTVLPIWTVQLSDVPGESALRLGMFSLPHSIGALGGVCTTILYSLHSVRQVLQLVVPIAIGLWFMRRKRDPGQLHLAS
jgi:hypothetical protein